MKKKLLQYTLAACALLVAFSSCRKQSFGGEEVPTAGKTFVWINQAGGDPYIQYFDVFTDVKPVALFTVRRDPANNADLNKAVTVTLTADPDSTDASGLTPLTGDLYTFPTASDVASGGVYAGTGGITANAQGTVLTVNFAAGEFAKNIVFKVDGSKLDLSKTYGAVYKITNFGGFQPKVGYSVVAAGIAVKNQYDGVYSYTGNVERFNADGSADLASALGGTIADGHTIKLVTNGPNSNTVDPILYWSDGSTGIGGLGTVLFTVDPATNKVTVTSSANASLKNIDGADNYYDPASGTYHLNFGWYTGTVGSSSSRKLHLVLGYSGSR